MKKAEVDKLLCRVADGDNNAFEQLYVSTGRGVYAFVLSYLHSRQDAEDVVQNVYLKIKTSVCGYRRGTNASAWILQIAKNTALDFLRKRKQEIYLDEIEHIGKSDEVDSGEVITAIEKHLSEEEQRIVILHALWGYKHREIGHILSLPTGTVTSKYKRSIEKLQKVLKEV